MSTLNQYTSITYFIEIIAISLLSLALIAVITAIFFRQWSGKAEHKKIVALRNSMQYEKNKVDITIREIIDIERETHGNLAATKTQMNVIEEQQKAISDKSKEIELRAEHIALLENEVKQTAEILSERIDNIEKRWDEKLEKTVQTVDQLSSILEENLKHIRNQNIAANNLTQSLTDQYDALQLEQKQSAINTSIESTLKASTQLNAHLEGLQQKAEDALTQFSNKLDNLDKKITQEQPSRHQSQTNVHEIEVTTTSPIEKQPVKSKEKTMPLPIKLDKPPRLDAITAENLTELSELKDYIYKDFFPRNKKKVNE